MGQRFKEVRFEEGDTFYLKDGQIYLDPVCTIMAPFVPPRSLVEVKVTRRIDCKHIE